VAAARRKALLDEIVSEVEASGGSALAVETEVSDPSRGAGFQGFRVVEATIAAEPGVRTRPLKPHGAGGV
jgi:hypothetical protein